MYQFVFYAYNTCFMYPILFSGVNCLLRLAHEWNLYLWFNMVLSGDRETKFNIQKLGKPNSTFRNSDQVQHLVTTGQAELQTKFNCSHDRTIKKAYTNNTVSRQTDVLHQRRWQGEQCPNKVGLEGNFEWRRKEARSPTTRGSSATPPRTRSPWTTRATA